MRRISLEFISGTSRTRSDIRDRLFKHGAVKKIEDCLTMARTGPSDGDSILEPSLRCRDIFLPLPSVVAGSSIPQTPVQIALSGKVAPTLSQIWFKTKPLDLTACRRISHVQLFTQLILPVQPLSPPQFRLAILAGRNHHSPRMKHGKPLIWRSHSLWYDQEPGFRYTSQYGVVFERKSELIASLEVSGVFA